MSYKGRYKVKNIDKFEGDSLSCIYRSLLERRFMVFCDTNSSVLQWNYENVIIPYICETDRRPHRYFVDFYLKIKKKDGTIEECLVEIKPKSETSPPAIPQRKNRRYITEALTYVKNMSKWQAAENFCVKRGWKFKIITEKDLLNWE